MHIFAETYSCSFTLKAHPAEMLANWRYLHWCLRVENLLCTGFEIQNILSNFSRSIFGREVLRAYIHFSEVWDMLIDMETSRLNIIFVDFFFIIEQKLFKTNFIEPLKRYSVCKFSIMLLKSSCYWKPKSVYVPDKMCFSSI